MRRKKQIAATALLSLTSWAVPAVWAQQAARPSAKSKADGSELKIVAADVQMLLVAPNGRETGYGPKTKKIIKGIAASAYYQDALLAYDTGRTDLSTTQTVDVRHVAAGKYRLMVTGGGLADGESYEVRVTLYRADGSEAGNARIAGRVEHDRAQTYELRVSADPAAVVIVHGVPGN
jgi:hypothetical protein